MNIHHRASVVGMSSTDVGSGPLVCRERLDISVVFQEHLVICK